MADIRIVPGSSIMSFTSSLNFIEKITQDASGSLNLYGSGSTGRTEILSVDGNNGRLFTVSDDLSDSLFSVNTIAGLPVIEAFADNTVNIGTFSSPAIVVNGTTASITGSLFGTASYTDLVKIQTQDTTPVTFYLTFAGGTSGYNSLNIDQTTLTYYPNTGTFSTPIVNSTTGVRGGDGSAAAPAFSFSGDTNNGMYRITTDTLGFSTAGSERMRITSTGNVGIGTTSPSTALDVVGKITLNDGGNSVFIGTDSGLNDDAGNNRNVGIGYQTLYSNTTGNSNTANGAYALYSNTSGYYNTANGSYALYSNTTSIYNTANGYRALYSNTTGQYNTANGGLVLYSNTTGGYNTAYGYQAGRYIVNGSTANTTGDYNVFLGANTKALADNDQNEIVIGYDAIGLGSNSVVLGNNSITTTALKGNVGIGTTSPSAKLEVNGTININSIGDRVFIADPSVGTFSIGDLDSLGDEAQIVGDATTIKINNAGNTTLTSTFNNTIGIGTTSPQGKLHVYQTTNLGGTAGNSLILQTLQNTGGSGGNAVYIKDYAYRDATGTSWTTWRSHNSIDIDGSYNTPGTNTRTFWERDPLSELHIFGSATRKVLNIDASSNQRVGINVAAPSYPLHVSGNVSNTSIYATNDIVAFSDQSVKTNIRPIENALERVVQSRGVLYDRTDSENKDNIGFIAQELEVAFPELVVTNEDGTKAVKYQNTVAVLFEAIKEQQKQIEELKQIVNGFTK